MTKPTITRERARQIFLGNGPEPSASEERELARMALAAMDSEPVYQYQSGVYNDDNGETDWYWDDCDKGFYEQYAHDRRRILYRHAQPAPVVPDEKDKTVDADDHPLLWSFNEGWNACRAAMLAAAQQEVKGE
ncbi:hypothetical protein P2116_004664 [Klebsiella quasipneumoniae]